MSGVRIGSGQAKKVRWGEKGKSANQVHRDRLLAYFGAVECCFSQSKSIKLAAFLVQVPRDPCMLPLATLPLSGVKWGTLGFLLWLLRGMQR